MAIKSDYISGTLTITQGSTAFTGTGTGWRSAEFKEGDTLIDITGATEYMGVIEAITGEATGTLTKPWEGPTLTNVPYRMRYQPDGARSTAQARNLIEILGNGNITAFALLNGAANLLPMFTGPGAMTLITRQALVSGAAYDVQVATLADRAAYDGQDQGYAVLVSNTGDGRAAIYSKNSATSGDWSEPAYVTGAVGPVVQIVAGNTTNLPAGQNATLVVRPITDGYALDFGIPRGLTGDNGADGEVGATGPRGEGLQIGATGDLAGRAAYDNEAEGFSYVDVENGNLYFRMGAPGNWSDPIPFGKGDKGDPGDSGAAIVTTNGVGNGTAGPYTLNEAPASQSATWATISGVTQYDFTLSGNQITFGLPVLAGIPWQVKSSGVLSVITPADGSVGASKINTGEAAGIRTVINAAAKPVTAVAGNLAVFDANREVQDTGISKATTTQAQVGTNDTNYMTPLKTAQAILALSPPTDVSGLYSSVSILALSLADLQGSRLLMNGGVADPFDDESGISTSVTSPIPGSTGTLLSNMTYQGRQAAAFDGITSQINTQASAIVGSGTGYAGKTFATAKKISSVTTYGCSDYGYESSSQSSTITIMLRGKNGTAPTNFATDGTLLGSISTLNPWNSNPQTISSNDILNSWEHVWVHLTTSAGSGANLFLAEVIFSEIISAGLSNNQVYDSSLDLYRPSPLTVENLFPTNMTADNLPSPYVASADAFYPSQNPFLAFDSSDTTYWQDASATIPSHLKIDLGAANAGPMGSYTIVATSAAPNNAPKDFIVQGSNDNSNWTNIDTQTGIVFSAGQSRTFTLSTPSASFRYYRLRITLNNISTNNYVISSFRATKPALSSNMTLISVPYTATSVPTQGRLVVQLDTPLTLVTGDFDGAISRDGGTTWVNMPLTLTGSVGNVKTYESLSLVNFTGASGSSLLFRVRTLTNKNIPVSGVVMQWK